jgi:hypothetical protein
MPASPIVIDEEFYLVQLSNGDGTLLEVWVTVTDGTPSAPGHFTVRWENGSSRDAKVTLKRDGEPNIEVVLDPGPGSFNAGSRLYSDWRAIEISSASRD